MNRTHGMTGTRLFYIWQNMLKRCYNHNSPKYKDYGGRGITVCEEWRESFTAFQKWAVESGYQDDLKIDRKDNNGNYCPENCHWATDKEQANNKRTNRLITCNGKTQTLAQWAEEMGIPRQTINSRINKLGWSAERALAKGARK